MKRACVPLFVIPAQAGIQKYTRIHINHLLDSRLRGNDGMGFAEANHDNGVFIRRIVGLSIIAEEILMGISTSWRVDEATPPAPPSTGFTPSISHGLLLGPPASCRLVKQDNPQRASALIIFTGRQDAGAPSGYAVLQRGCQAEITQVCDESAIPFSTFLFHVSNPTNLIRRSGTFEWARLPWRP
jgi:hypothetical protein